MQIDPQLSLGEAQRHAMRHWVTGVTIVTSRLGEVTHGMTVSSFVSLSLNPPLVSVTMNNSARTCQLVEQSRIFAVTILSLDQVALAERFAGRMDEYLEADRFAGLETFTLVSGAPLLVGGVACFDCRVTHSLALGASTLFLGEVLSVRSLPEDAPPLLYHNRTYRSLR